MALIILPARRTIIRTGLLAVGYVLVATVFDRVAIIPGGIGLRPAAAYPIVLSLVFGLGACFGAAMGVVLLHVIRGVVGVPTLFVAIGTFVLGIVSMALWRSHDSLHGPNSPRLTSIPHLIRFAFVAFIAAVSGGATIGWGFEVLNHQPFYLVAMRTTLTSFLSSLLFGVPLLYLVTLRISGPILEKRANTRTSILRGSGWSKSESRLVAVMTAWFVLGFCISLGLKIFSAIPEPSLAKHTVEILAMSKYQLLWTGWVLQALIGTGTFFLLLRYCTVLIERRLNEKQELVAD